MSQDDKPDIALLIIFTCSLLILRRQRHAAKLEAGGGDYKERNPRKRLSRTNNSRPSFPLLTAVVINEVKNEMQQQQH